MSVKELVESAVFSVDMTKKLEIDEEEAWLSVRRAITRVMNDNAFYGELLSGLEVLTGRAAMQLMAKVGCRTAMVYVTEGGDNIGLAVDPLFYARLTEDQRQGVMLHEIMHLALMHLGRGAGKRPKMWNQAADASVNQYIPPSKLWKDPAPILPKSFEEFGVTLPEGDSVEAYYQILNEAFPEDHGGKPPPEEEQKPTTVFAEGETLETPNGPMKVEDLRSTDLLLFYNDNKGNVEKISISSIEKIEGVKILDMKTASGNSLRVGQGIGVCIEDKSKEIASAEIIQAALAGAVFGTFNGKSLEFTDTFVDGTVVEGVGYSLELNGIPAWLLSKGILVKPPMKHGPPPPEGSGKRENLTDAQREALRRYLEEASEEEFQELLKKLQSLK